MAAACKLLCQCDLGRPPSCELRQTAHEAFGAVRSWTRPTVKRAAIPCADSTLLNARARADARVGASGLRLRRALSVTTD
eukprot:6187274-Pleurochrysis_carterae.AAC.1